MINKIGILERLASAKTKEEIEKVIEDAKKLSMSDDTRRKYEKLLIDKVK